MVLEVVGVYESSGQFVGCPSVVSEVIVGADFLHQSADVDSRVVGESPVMVDGEVGAELEGVERVWLP